MADLNLMLRAAEELTRKSQSEDVRKLAEIVAELCRQLDAAERSARRTRTADGQSQVNTVQTRP
jgi:hypothetical protein